MGSGYPIKYKMLLPDGSYGILESDNVEHIDFQIKNLVEYGTMTKPVIELEEKPTTEISDGTMPVTSMDNVPNKAEIVLDQEGMVTTPVDGHEGDVVVSDGIDHDPVTPKE